MYSRLEGLLVCPRVKGKAECFYTKTLVRFEPKMFLSFSGLNEHSPNPVWVEVLQDSW